MFISEVFFYVCVTIHLQHCRIIVPPELGYPENDFNKKGPRPTTFSVIFDYILDVVIEMVVTFSD